MNNLRGSSAEPCQVSTSLRGKLDPLGTTGKQQTYRDETQPWVVESGNHWPCGPVKGFRWTDSLIATERRLRRKRLQTGCSISKFWKLYIKIDFCVLLKFVTYATQCYRNDPGSKISNKYVSSLKSLRHLLFMKKRHLSKSPLSISYKTSGKSRISETRVLQCG